MGWRELVAGTMPTGAPFGVHPNDQKRAKESIKSAKSEGATFSDFAGQVFTECHKHLSHPINYDTVSAQIERAREMWGK